MAGASLPGVRHVARDRGGRIGQDADQGRRRIGEPPVDLLEREHEHRPERAQHVGGERRGQRDADLEGVERQHDQDGGERRQRRRLAGASRCRRARPCARPHAAAISDQQHIAHRGHDLGVDAVIVQPLAIEQAHRDRGAADEKRREAEQRRGLAAAGQSGIAREHDPGERHERQRDPGIAEVLPPSDMIGLGETDAERGQATTVSGPMPLCIVLTIDGSRWLSPKK